VVEYRVDMAKQIPITKMGWKCQRCGHLWVPNTEGFAPAVCPKCKSPYWNRPRRAKKR